MGFLVKTQSENREERPASAVDGGFVELLQMALAAEAIRGR